MVNHFTIMAFKALLRFKVHSLVGLISLVLGFSCFIFSQLVANYVNDFDLHFPHADKLYTLAQTQSSPSSGLSMTTPVVGKPAAEYLRTAFPELEYVVRAAVPEQTDVTADGSTDTLRVRYVESGFFQLFPIPMLAGLEPGADLPPNSVVISENAARQRFGTTDVVGRSIRLAHQFDLTIAGVSSTLDRPSHIESALPILSSDLIAPIELHDQLSEDVMAQIYADSNADRWGHQIFYTYLRFPPGTVVDEAVFNERMIEFSEQYVPQLGDIEIIYSIQPINELTTSALEGLFGGMDITAALMVAGYLVLLIACLNYSNLLIAQLSLRSQEIGMQKILGARRGLLVLQYSYESLLFAIFALALTLLLFYLVLTLLRGSDVPGVTSGLLLDPALWADLAVVMLIITAIAGAYPALRTLRGTLVSLLRPKGASGYSTRLRSAMVGVQFMISCTLIVLTLVMLSQNRAMTRQLDGDQADPKVAITVPVDALTVDSELLLDRLQQHPGVVSATMREFLPWSFAMSSVRLSNSPDAAAPRSNTAIHSVGYDYAQTLGIPLLAGRLFSRARSNDLIPALTERLEGAGPYNVIIDEAAVRALGWASPEQAIGQSIYEHVEPPQSPSPATVELVVAGVVGDAPFQIVNWALMGMEGHVYFLQPDFANYMLIRLSRQDVRGAMGHIEEVWSSLMPEVSLKRQFVDDLFRSSYRMFITLSTVIAGLAALGFFIASIGLLGNATFVTSMRQKEVGIRKVMGARAWRLLAMLLMDFARPVMIANAMAWPLAYVLAKAYLSLFSVQASLTLFPFLASFGISVLIACLAVFSQAYKSARVRPAMVLRYE